MGSKLEGMGKNGNAPECIAYPPLRSRHSQVI